MRFVFLKKLNIITVLLLLIIATRGYSQHDLYGLWSKRAVFGYGGNASITSSVTDEDGNVYIAGQFTGTLNFSDDICNPIMRTSVDATANPFLIKYDKNGKYVWDVVFSPETSGGNTARAAVNYDLQYSNGKVLFATSFRYLVADNTLPMVVNVKGVGSGNSKVLTSVTTEVGTLSGPTWGYPCLQVVDCSTGKLETSINDFPTGASDFVTRIEGDKIIATHYGNGAAYPSAVGDGGRAGSTYSVVSTYQLADGTPILSNLLYPGQPLSPMPANCDGSRIRRHIVLPDGSQIFLHYAHDFTDISANGNGIPSYYLMKYNAGFTTKQSQVLLTARETSSNLTPKITNDAAGNIYVMMDFGDSKYWNTGVPIANSNTLTNFVGSGKNFTTADQCNKVVLAKLNDNLDYVNGSSWAIQIGSSISGDTVYGTDIKVVGDYIYVVGRFFGQNVPFGNGITLNSNGKADGFYAVYDNSNGNCLYAVNMGGELAENITTLNLSSTAKEILLGGNYVSSVFQSDPSGRLYPLSGNGSTSQAFITLFSTDPNSIPTPYASSFGDAPSTYGLAVHYVYPCLRLGELDMSNLQSIPAFSLDADSDSNDDAVLITYTNGYVDLNSNNFKLDASGNLIAQVTVNNGTNESAKLIGWIDFNKNGVFDGASEASTAVTVAANSSTTVPLTWVGANTKLKTGTTYMRLRLTTDIMDEDQPEGLLFNGDVEDYRLDFNLLELGKTAVSDNTNPAIAGVGDIITYTLTLNNTTFKGDVELFDPIPEGTEYVDSDPAGTLVSLNLYGQTVQAVQWNLLNLDVDVKTYKFRVKVVGKPANSDSILNIAFAVMNGDTISSAGANCNFSEIEVSKIEAFDDYVSIFHNETVEINVLANDYFLSTCTVTPSIVNNPVHGSATISGDVVQYTPGTDFVGRDSITYEIECDGTTSQAKVYILVTEKPDNISDADCYDDPPGTAFSIKRLAVSDATPNVYNAGVPLVGDIDNDGITEIVVAGGTYPGPAGGYTANQLLIFKVINDQVKHQQTISTPYFIAGLGAPFSFAKVDDGNDYAAIFLCTSGYANTATNQRQLIKYVYNGTSYVEERRVSYSSIAAKQGGIPYITDFNGDGKAEIVVYDKVFDAETLTLLADGQLLGTAGMGFGEGAFYVSAATTYGSYMAVADMDGDGLPEVVGGNCVYKVEITNNTSTAGNSFKLWSKCDGIGPGGELHGEVGDGCTAVADMDGDGLLDVVVTIKGNVNTLSDKGSVYVWNPRTGKVMHTNSINNIDVNGVTSGPSAPFIGDIDNDGEPEICFTGNKKMYAFDYDKDSKELVLKWAQTTSDGSACTTMSMFDFNQDGAAELVYRDETHLRILDGATGMDMVTKMPLYAGTVNEYPIVADVNGDGAAEIIVVGNLVSGYTQGRICIYSSDPVGTWAPARKVWNQYAYNAVNINEDLTIPKYQVSPAKVFPGKDGILGTADDVRPYNGYLMQQTILSKDGVQLWLLPELQLNSPTPAFSYYAAGDSMVVTLNISNTGEAVFYAPVKITVYKDVVASTSIKHTYSYPYNINPGNSATITFTIPNYSAWVGAVDNSSKLLLKINDNGNGQNDQQVCRDNNVTFDKDLSALLLANNDTAVTQGENVIIDVLANDSLASCSNITLTSLDTIANSGLHHGSLVINPDNTFSYLPNSAGIDSVDYYIKCGSDYSAARVYIASLKPYAMHYTACPGADVTLGFSLIAGVQYDWFNADGTVLAQNTNEITVTKDNSGTQNWYVQVSWNGILFPRYEVNLWQSDNCGAIDPNGCVETGTLIFRETFGGNDVTDPRVSLTGLPAGVTEYNFSFDNTTSTPNTYWLLKSNENHQTNLWQTNFSDHTYPDDVTKGYMFMVDASNDGRKFYEYTITDLCDNVGKLYFSTWVANLMIQGKANPDDPNLRFELSDINDNVLASYTTGNVPRDAENELKWRLYGFEFALPEGHSTIKLKIFNNTPGSSGNDFVMDDIEIRICAPEVEITQPTQSEVTICAGTDLIFEGNYTDDGTFTANGENLVYRWEWSTTGDVSEPSEWSVVSGSQFSNISGTSSNGVVNAQLILTGADITDAKFYRLVVANTSTIDKYNCRAMSRIIELKINSFPTKYPDIRVQICTDLTSVNLTKYLNTGGFKSVDWSRVTGLGPNINSNGILTINNDLTYPHTYIYKYEVENICDVKSDGKLFLKTINNSVIGLPPDTVVVCYCDAQELQLNRILGIEAAGIIEAVDLTAQEKTDYISYPVAPALFAGASIFNGYNLYLDLLNANSASYKYSGPLTSDAEARAIKFRYTPAAGSCLDGKTFDFVIIITNNVVN